MVLRWIGSKLGRGARPLPAPAQRKPDRGPAPQITPDPLNDSQPLYRYTTAPDTIIEPLDEGSSFEAISAHVELYVGPGSHVLHEIRSDRVHIDLIPVPPSDTHPSWTLVTSGMSDLPMTAPKEAPECVYAELVFRLPPSWPFPDIGSQDYSLWDDEANYWPIRLLKILARMPHTNRSWLWMGHTVDANGGDPLGPGVDFTSALLLPPLSMPSSFKTLQVSPQKTIHFFTVVPLYASETEFKRRHGFDAFIDHLPRPEELEIFDPRRAAFV